MCHLCYREERREKHMKSFRYIGAVFLFFGTLNFCFEFYNAVFSQRGFRLLDTGEVWARIHRESLLQLQPAVERYLTPWLWDPVIFTVLQTPLTPMCLILGGLCYIAGAPRLSIR